MQELRGHDARLFRAVRPLVVDSLEVRHGNVTAVTELSFLVGPGRIAGVLGPNGEVRTTQ